MAIDKKKLTEEFRSLSTRYGGNLFSERQLLEQDEITVFFGLGGLGSKAVNAIKAAADNRLKYPDRRFYMCVDTCERDMDLISAATRADIEDPDSQNDVIKGCILEDEKLALCESSYKIKTLGHDVDTWLNRAYLGEVEVDKKGAQGIRQIGRVMLMANGNYAKVYEKISALLNKAKTTAKAKQKDLKIYIIAGISGGTGSGTIVDFSYMVKKAISGFENNYKKIDAIIFTPDVQYNDHGIDENKKKGLRANFYAALKEIDFFFNASSRAVTYKCPYSAHCSAYEEDIFDTCTVISRRAQGVDIAENSGEVLQMLADALTFEISGIQGRTNQAAQQSYNAFFSNVHNNFQLWWPSNSSGEGLDMPEWAPSRYSSLSYASFYIPRDELLAYSANRLVERLVEQWKTRDVTQEQIDDQLRGVNLISNRSFAKKLFSMSEKAPYFDSVEKKEKPVDGFGPASVKNCESYLELMKYIAESEGVESGVRQVLKLCSYKLEATFVDPLISAVDRAFMDGDKGPVYAINLLSAGIANSYSGKRGVLASIRDRIESIVSDSEMWALELQQVYSELLTRAQSYDGKMSVDAEELARFTDECTNFGKDLFTCKLLSYSDEYLKKIFELLNDKNNKVFDIYTYTFETLLSLLKKDSEYVTNTQRVREGHVTVFSFDMTNFQENDELSQRFKLFFDTVVDTKDLDEQSKMFVSMIFGSMKQLLDPATEDNKNTVVQPSDIIDLVRNYFKTSFAEWTTDIIEKFCVVAYSDLEATPERITAVWNNPAQKQVALQRAHAAISGKINANRRILMTCADDARDLQNFCAYETFACIPNTPNINNLFDSHMTLSSDWSEFIGYKRIFGFPIGLLAALDECKADYDKQATTAGIHLDEMYDEKDGFGDWRDALPEPYSYTVSRFLGKYEDGGSYTTEADRKHMKRIYDLANTARELGILVRTSRDLTKAEDNNPQQNRVISVFYGLKWKLINDIDFSASKTEIYDNMFNAVNALLNKNEEPDFISVLEKAGYRIADDTGIQWIFKRPEYNVMTDCTVFGDESDFGNFIILVRSNPYWEVSLRKGVELFSKFREIYDRIIADVKDKSIYNDRLGLFIKAVRAGRFVPAEDRGLFVGYKTRLNNKAEDDVIFSNAGLDILDKKFFLYLAYTESFLKLDERDIAAFTALINHEFTERAELKKESVENAKAVLSDCQEVLSDSDYLAHYDKNTVKENIAKRLALSGFGYSVPVSSKGKTDVDAVISNLESFYKFVKDELEENLEEDMKNVSFNEPVQTQAQPQVQTQPQTQASDEWTCKCGAKNTRKFCMECGDPKPVQSEAGVWFCPGCGAKNTSKFCMECGTKKPGAAPSFCPDCGWKPEPGTTPRFCPECGHKF